MTTARANLPGRTAVSKTEITAVPLTTVEETRLVELETVVTDGLDTFVKVGNALAEIREAKLYRATHGTFDAYVQDRWNFTSRRARHLIAAAEIGTMVPVQNERQARELTGLDPEQANTVYRVAMTASGDFPTAGGLHEARERVVKSRRRSPLPDLVQRHAYDLAKVAELIHRLKADPRWATNRESIRTKVKFEIQVSIDTLAEVVRDLGMGELVLLTPEMNRMGAANETEFEAALAAARADDDLSAENVVRHLEGGS